MFFGRRKRVISLFTLTFYLLSLFQQVTVPVNAIATIGNAPVKQDSATMPIGTEDISSSSNNPGLSKESLTTGIPIPRNENAQDTGRVTIPGKSLRTDGIHRKYILPDGVKGEFTDARTKNSKVFVKEDGHYISVITGNSLHYQDANGKWQDIDSRLKSASFAGYVFENTANRFQTFFADKGKEKLLRFQYGDKWFELNPVNRNEVTPEVNGDTITYPNIYNGVDLQYIVGSDSLKENLILNNFTGVNTFSYNLEEHNLTHKLESDGTISFFDKTTGKYVWSMSAPFMYDANNAESRNLSFKLEEVNNKIVLTLEADSTWLSAPERIYPVVLDPNVILNDGLKNTFVRHSSDLSDDSKNFKNNLDLQVGYWFDPNYNVISRSYLNFDVKNKVKVANGA